MIAQVENVVRSSHEVRPYAMKYSPPVQSTRKFMSSGKDAVAKQCPVILFCPEIYVLGRPLHISENHCSQTVSRWFEDFRAEWYE